MNAELAVEVTRLGLACDLLAFFLAAPELIGENGLRRLRDRMRVVLWWASVVLFALSLLLILPFLFSGFLFVLGLLHLPGITGRLIDRLLPVVFLGPLLSAAISWIPRASMALVESLSDNRRTRRLLLNSGILLFVLGILAQFIGTF